LVGRNPLGSGAGFGKGPALAFFSREVEMTRALLVAMLLFGGPTVAVPKVVGLSYEQAKTRINERGLQVGNVEPGYCTRPVGAVVERWTSRSPFT
jgi:hypothetical protein